MEKETGKVTSVFSIPLVSTPIITEIKGSCPACGGPLELKDHILAWNADGTPSESDKYKDPYCPKCEVFWLSEPA